MHMADWVGRANVFAIHSWINPDVCRRLVELLRDADPNLAHYSILPERALGGNMFEILRNIEHRIRLATAVLIVNTPDLYKRETARYEMETAVRMGKRIVVVQPHGEFATPIPAVINGHVYKYAPWRSDVVGRAIRGEYPGDGRVFDIAEVAARRDIVALLAAGVAAMSCVVIIRDLVMLDRLRDELRAQGVVLQWSGDDTATVVKNALGVGAAAGLIAGLLTGDLKTALWCAAGGLATGAAVGVHRVYRAHLLGEGQHQVLVIEPA
jgi:hypothetical protein